MTKKIQPKPNQDGVAARKPQPALKQRKPIKPEYDDKGSLIESNLIEKEQGPTE